MFSFRPATQFNRHKFLNSFFNLNKASHFHNQNVCCCNGKILVMARQFSNVLLSLNQQNQQMFQNFSTATFPIDNEHAQPIEIEDAAAASDSEEGKSEEGNVLAQKTYRQAAGQWFCVEYRRDENDGQKFFSFHQKNGAEILDFPKIYMPGDLAFVKAMDEMLNTVHAKKEFIEGFTRAQEKDEHTEETHSLHIVQVQEQFQLNLCMSRPNQTIHVQMCNLANANGEELDLPLRQFHWLRYQIGQILAEHREEDILQRIGKTPHFPAWIRNDSIPRAALPQQNIRNQNEPQGTQQDLLETVKQQTEELLVRKREEFLKTHPGMNPNVIFTGTAEHEKLFLSDLQKRKPENPAMRRSNNRGYGKKLLDNRFVNNGDAKKGNG